MSIVEQLQKAVGNDAVITDPQVLEDRRHDYWVLSHVDDIQDRAAKPPACVVRPTTTEDVVSVVNACRSSNTALIPFGLGSGVCGGVITNVRRGWNFRSSGATGSTSSVCGSHLLSLSLRIFVDSDGNHVQQRSSVRPCCEASGVAEILCVFEHIRGFA